MDVSDSSHINDDQTADPVIGLTTGAIRVAAPSDIDGIVETLTSAFFDDPLWGPAFPDVTRRAAQASAFWRLLATSAGRYPWTLVTEQLESVAIWIPPDANELTSEEEDSLRDFLVEITDDQTGDEILAITDLFGKARPSEPHYYLSLLATHKQHRGLGSGMALLRENLARLNVLGAPAYLESTNSVNNERYESVGFRPHGSFTVPSGHVVTTMWRPANS